jgi:outer membrane protein assembly factor BamB
VSAPTPAGLTPAWEAAVGAVVASPVLAAGHVAVPTADGRLLFVDPGSGRRLHELRLGSAVESSPAVAGRRLHVGTDDGEIVGVDVVDGRERYRTRVGRLVRSSPLVVGDRLVAGVIEARSAGHVVGLDPDTGKLRWTRRLAASFSSPARAGNLALIGADDGSLHALDAGTGDVVWSHALGGKVRATPAVTAELVLAADFDGRVAAVRVKDGTRVWLQELGHTVYSSPCVAGDLCVVGCHEGHVHGLRLESGEPRFEVQTRGPVVASAVAAGERFLVGSTDGELYLIDRSGTVVERARLSGKGIQSSAALDLAGTAFVGSGTGLHALRLQP